MYVSNILSMNYVKFSGFIGINLNAKKSETFIKLKITKPIFKVLVLLSFDKQNL